MGKISSNRLLACATFVGILIPFCCVASAVATLQQASSTPSRTNTPIPTLITAEPPAVEAANTETSATSIAAPTKTSEPQFTATAVTPARAVALSEMRGASCIPNRPFQTGKAVDVVDGDTIKVVLDQDGLTYSVRYIGMDTPEMNPPRQLMAAEATAKNRSLVYGKSLLLFKDVSETDRYNRLLRYVVAEDLFVNFELVIQGYATTATFPPDIACLSTFLEAEREASTRRLGLWAIPTMAVLPTVQSGANCSPYYPDACLQTGIGDYDCAGGSGNGPNYASGPITVLPPDPFNLDGDGDGVGCE